MASNLLLVLSGNGSGRVGAHARHFGYTRGLSLDAARMWIAGDRRLFHLANRGGRTIDGVAYDAVYMPQQAHFVGNALLHDVMHDVTLGGEPHEVAFVNTSYSVIATVDRDHSFRPLWKPRHISRLMPEDRCHLNCVGIRDGAITWASVFSQTDTAEGWRAAPSASGVIIDVASHEVVCAGLTKMHTLRWHQDRLWVLDSVSGDLGHVDEREGRFISVAHLGNFLRGMALIGDYAIVGATALRGQPLRAGTVIPGLSQSVAGASALYVVDLRTGAVAHALIMAGINAIYDVQFLPGVLRPFIGKLGAPEDDDGATSFAPHSLFA